MVKVTAEMMADGKIEKKEMECNFFVGVGMSDIPGLSFIPGMRGLAAECLSMGGDVVVGDVVETLAIAISQIVEGFAEDPEKKRFLKKRFIEKLTEAADSTNKTSATVIISKGGC